MSIYQLPSGSGISEIPRELVYDMMLMLPGKVLVRLCQTNRWFSRFCDEKNETFWQQKLERDFSISDNTENYSIKTFYFKLVLGQIKQINLEILYNVGEIEKVGTMLINQEETLQQILDQLIQVSTDFILKYNTIGRIVSITLKEKGKEIFGIFDFSFPQIINNSPIYQDLQYLKIINMITRERIK